MSAGDNRHPLRMAVNDFTAFSSQLAALWSPAIGVLISASTIRQRLLHRALRSRVPLHRIPSQQTIDGCVFNGSLHRALQSDSHQVVFLDKSRFNLWYHVDSFRVRRYIGQYCLLEFVTERHSGQTPGIMV